MVVKLNYLKDKYVQFRFCNFYSFFTVLQRNVNFSVKLCTFVAVHEVNNEYTNQFTWGTNIQLLEAE